MNDTLIHILLLLCIVVLFVKNYFNKESIKVVGQRTAELTNEFSIIRFNQNELSNYISQLDTKNKSPKPPDFSGAIEKCFSYLDKMSKSDTDNIIEDSQSQRLEELEQQLKDLQASNDGLLDIITEKNKEIEYIRAKLNHYKEF